MAASTNASVTPVSTMCKCCRSWLPMPAPARMPACAPEARTITCKVLSEDKIAIKYRYSAFIPYPSELDDLLRTHGIDTLLVTGVATSTCCESTARDAAMWGYRTIMVSDGNADQTDALHNHTLGKFLVTFGDVQATDDLLAKLGVRRRRTEGIPIQTRHRATALSRALASPTDGTSRRLGEFRTDGEPRSFLRRGP